MLWRWVLLLLLATAGEVCSVFPTPESFTERFTPERVSCKDSCEPCGNIDINKEFFEDDFKRCNVCGGVEFVLECTIKNEILQDKEIVQLKVAAGAFQKVLSKYYFTVDCARNIMFTELRPEEVETQMEKKENGHGKAKENGEHTEDEEEEDKLKYHLVLASRRAKPSGKVQKPIITTVPTQAVESEMQVDPRDPLGPGIIPQGWIVLVCKIK